MRVKFFFINFGTTRNLLLDQGKALGVVDGL